MSRPPEVITLLEIFEAVEEPFEGSGCMLDKSVCDGRRDCVLGTLVQSLNGQVRDFLTGCTLSELTDHVGLPILATH